MPISISISWHSITSHSKQFRLYFNLQPFSQQVITAIHSFACWFELIINLWCVGTFIINLTSCASSFLLYPASLWPSWPRMPTAAPNTKIRYATPESAVVGLEGKRKSAAVGPNGKRNRSRRKIQQMTSRFPSVTLPILNLLANHSRLRLALLYRKSMCAVMPKVG